MTKNTRKKSQASEGKTKTKATQEEIDEFPAQISNLIGQVTNSGSGIVGEATRKIKDLAGDESLKPIFKELKEYLKRNGKPSPSSLFNLFDKFSMPRTDREIIF
ncbi:hypothetical protein TREPR_2832 [Treponema primitia ZAS-2]|uniref:Uncharacterized protein n=1 Tax=Treponema primitia (strain ATCC BAA-887 / DSM 12427 / ZAS-2) TaxID=545694 RepID=F5YPV9_TREPZ|nr:hypothetical protein [Treponema primitia]AEF84344.1 hypothetical protein TREPR_2832 [Treponema primitia ZAS-2]